MKIEKAKRKAVPLLISLAGVSGSGKSYSALLMAAGLAGDGKVGFLDTENGRGGLYADDSSILTALPNGYELAEMKEPFSPSRYSEAVDAFEQHGCKVLIIDSMTHEFEGYGGCTDIAENNKLRGMANWAKAKLEHKRMMNRLLASNMHLILCLRAREKVKILADGKFQQLGLQPICEKNMPFEMTLSLMLDEETHRPTVTKCPKPLLPLFHREMPLVTVEMGRKLREWSESGEKPNEDNTALYDQAMAYAEDGTKSLQDFWSSLTKSQQLALKPNMDEAKKRAAEVDAMSNDTDQSLLG